MLGAAQKVCRGSFELFNGSSFVGFEKPSSHHLQIAVVTLIVLGDGTTQPAIVLLDDRLPRLARAQGRVLLGHNSQPAKQEVPVDHYRLFAPKRAVIVEDRNSRLGRNKIRLTFSCYPRDKIDDGALGRTVHPRSK